jgi:hypothetical protein
MGNISGGGIVTSASCKQKFTVSRVLAGDGKAGEREVAYSFIERAVGFPLPDPTRPVAKGEKVVLVLAAGGDLIKVIPDMDEHRKEIEAITKHVKSRPPAARALLRAMGSFTLKIEYHGPNPDAHPSVWCTTSHTLPDRLPPKWLVSQNLSQVWAHQALDHLVKAGVLTPENIRAERTRPRPKEPYYSLTLSADGVDELSFHLGWGKEAHARIQPIYRAMQSDDQAIARVLAKLNEAEKDNKR